MCSRNLNLLDVSNFACHFQVSDVTSRSAFVQWNHPDRFGENGENKFQEAG